LARAEDTFGPRPSDVECIVLAEEYQVSRTLIHHRAYVAREKSLLPVFLC
jgi:hypothetical protein